MIADPAGPTAIAGVMGGAASEVDDDDARRRRRVGDLRPGLDPPDRPALRAPLARRASGSRRARSSGSPASAPTARRSCSRRGPAERSLAGRVDTNPDEPERARVAFRPARVEPAARRRDPGDGAARAPGTGRRSRRSRPSAATPVVVSGEPQPQVVDPGAADPAADEVLVALVPTWRRDLAIEADVAEEVARVRGYERTPGTRPAHPDAAVPALAAPGPRPRPAAARRRRHLRGRDPRARRRRATSARFPAPSDDCRRSTARRPPAASRSPSRTRSRASTRCSASGCSAACSTSCARTCARAATTLRSSRSARATAAWTAGPTSGGGSGFALDRCGALRAAGTARSRTYDLDDAKGLVELLAREAGLAAADVRSAREPAGSPAFHPGRTARATAATPDGRSIGLRADVGELHPRLLEELEIRADRIVVAEIALRGLSGGRLAPVRAATVPRVPAVERDLAVVVDRRRRRRRPSPPRIRERGGPLLRSLRLFDVYPMPDGRRSLAYRLVLQAADRTLTDDEIEALVADVVAGLEALGVRLRA